VVNFNSKIRKKLVNSWQKKSIINPSVQKTSIGNRIQNQNYGQKRLSTFLYNDQNWEERPFKKQSNRRVNNH